MTGDLGKERVAALNFYNEIDHAAADWLRSLIKAGVLAPGVVDSRPIQNIRPDELSQYEQCHFFAGIGIWPAALRAAGWEDDRPVFTGSCPCQPFSIGGDRKGFDDERHLWPAFRWIIQNSKPSVVFGEQVASSLGRAWFEHVSTDLEALDYAVGNAIFPACGVGSPQLRERLYWLADSTSEGLQGQSRSERPKFREVRQATSRGPLAEPWNQSVWVPCSDGRVRPIEPGLCPLADGDSADMGSSISPRLKGYGNSMVLPQAVQFIRAYMDLL